MSFGLIYSETHSSEKIIQFTQSRIDIVPFQVSYVLTSQYAKS